MNPKHHVVISGTGRAGTTFIVQLLTQLGLDTGFANPYAKIAPHHHGGMEWDICKPDAPYIIKSPALCEHLEHFLETSNAVIDHAFLPVRDLYSAAESRRDVARKGDFKFLTPLQRGFRRIRKPSEQENVLAQHLYKLVYTLARFDIPVTLLYFPRLAKDPGYLFDKLKLLLGGVSYEEFASAFQLISRPELIHNFREQTFSAPTEAAAV